MIEYQNILDRIYADVGSGENPGRLANYIPELGSIDPEHFGVHLCTIGGEHYSAGHSAIPFSIQSIAKVLSLALVYRSEGAGLWERVGVEPSGNPFNSLVQLEYDNGIPRNPFINSGAIVVCDVLLTLYPAAKAELLHFVRALSGNEKIDYNHSLAQSERDTGFRNTALVNFIRSYGNIKNDIDEVLDLYCHLCSIEMNCRELAETFLFLAHGGKSILDNEAFLTQSQAKRINAIMLTCGFYDQAGDFAYDVGLPGKSGVGGGIAAVYPGHYSIAVWSPRLNEKGNSCRGMKFLEQFTTATRQSVF